MKVTHHSMNQGESEASGFPLKQGVSSRAFSFLQASKTLHEISLTRVDKKFQSVAKKYWWRATTSLTDDLNRVDAQSPNYSSRKYQVKNKGLKLDQMVFHGL